MLPLLTNYLIMIALHIHDIRTTVLKRLLQWEPENYRIGEDDIKSILECIDGVAQQIALLVST